jgi:hypothetical protein
MTWAAVLLIGIALGYAGGTLAKGHRRAIARAKLRYRQPGNKYVDWRR